MKAYDLALIFIGKGVQDEKTAAALLRNLDIADEIVGFHCQQATEKYMKAVLIAKKIEFRKTHDLYELLQLLDDHNVQLPDNSDALAELNPFAVAFRYDFLDEEPSFDRVAAMKLVESVHTWATAQINY